MNLTGSILNSYQRLFNKRLQKHRHTRNILLYCASDTMISHILNYYLQVKEDKNYHFYLYYDTEKTDKKTRIEKSKQICNKERIRPVIGKFRLILTHWDLIVTPDLDYEPLRYSKDIVPLLYVNHGSHIVSIDNKRTLYAYGERALIKGKSKFTAICEPNLRIYRELNCSEQFKDCVFHVGAKDADSIIHEIEKYSHYRKLLVIPDNVTLVSVFGTWRKESLFQYLGKEFLDELGKISKDEYMFVLSVHPREYVRYDESIEPMGPVLDEYAKKYGFIIRKPSESYIPYLIASDIVISDYSSLYENALLAKKKLIFSYFPDYSVGELSVANELKKEIRVIKRDDIPSIYEILEETRKNSLSDAIKKHASEIYVGEGYYNKRIREITEKLTGVKEDP